MNAPFLTACFGLFLWAGDVFADSTIDAAEAERYVVAIATARDAWQKSLAGEQLEAVRRIEEASLRREDIGFAVVEYVKCRLLCGTKKPNNANAELLELVESRAVSPEVVLGLLELNGGDRRIREELEECLAALLPLSVWGSLSDSRGIEFVADVNPPRPNIPTMDEQALTSLAEAAGQTGDHHLAWKAYIEAIYCGRAPSWMAESPQHDAWFSMDTAELWHRAAHHAKKANEATLAYDYLAKYAIFGSEAQFEEAKETFTKWQSDRKMEEEKEGDSAGQEKSLKKVFALYGQIHAHPRVLELIRSKRDGLGTPDELYAAYSKQWKSVLELCNRGVNGAVVYRVALTPNLDPTTIKIPWPCSPASVKEVRVRVVELLGNIE